MKIAHSLRRKGIKVEINMTERRLRKSLDYANKEGIPYVIILGENELTKGIVKVKDMYKGEDITIGMDELMNFSFS